MMPTLDDIRHILATHEPTLLPAEQRNPAAVAMILREARSGLEVLFIERSAHERDPWSGDLAFPGGKIEAGDATLRQAAERETQEEIGLDLQAARYLGRLSDVSGASLPVRVSCFVYGIGETGPFDLSGEVRDAFWVPLAELLSVEQRVEGSVSLDRRAHGHPAIRLSPPGKPLLWGLTYRLVEQFLELIEGR
jgi:8-oxo-dGTP pyrophosphatase MutT (NUDIX family)